MQKKETNFRTKTSQLKIHIEKKVFKFKKLTSSVELKVGFNVCCFICCDVSKFIEKSESITSRIF